MAQKRYRVAQWGTGHSGLRALRGIIQHPYFDLAGVRVYAEAKVGEDAGALCGLPPTGVRATNRIEDILDARPDCLMYFPKTEMSDLDDVCRVLEAGINIVTLLSEFYYLPALDGDARARLEAACARGRTSLYATGPSPGYATGPLALGAISFQRRLDAVKIYEFANLASRSADMNKWLFGWRPGEQDVGHLTELMRRYTGEALMQTAAAIGLSCDRTTCELELALATDDFAIRTMAIGKGTVAGWRFKTTAWRGEAPLMQMLTTWSVTAEHLDPPWETRDTDGWRMVVEGDTPLDLHVHFEKGYATTGDSSGYNAHICLNAVPSVCEARPGVLTPADLPPIVAQFAEVGA
jgi:4-hydroxy-tetrahydrodipicolinate reductase